MADSLTGIELPTDRSDAPVQVLAPGTIVNDDVDATTDRSVLPTGTSLGTGVVEVAVSNDTYIAFGTSTITVTTANGQFIPKGVSVYRVPDDAIHLAYIQSTTEGRITITAIV